MTISKLNEFLNTESASGIFLFIAAILAMIVVNSPFDFMYDALLNAPVLVRIGEYAIDKPLLLWINDGLMAIFFFLIGLEIKREVLVGELSEPSRVGLPIIAAVGGMMGPAVIYSIFNWNDPYAIRGWAVPSATDIAFALGVLSLFGSKVPQTLKLFLMTLAIADDLGAIIIIAIFYTTELSLISLCVAIGALIVLYLLNRQGILAFLPYFLVGLILWIAVLKSGVHATLAGVLLAFFIPFKKQNNNKQTQLEILEHSLHPSVAFMILPLFAFVNAGVSFDMVSIGSILHPISLGIIVGLIFGNQIGVFGFSWIAIKSGLISFPKGATWLQLYGISMLCGIGFTMSLFIGSLAFAEKIGVAQVVDERIGILIGSLISGCLGYLVLYFATKGKNT